MHCNSRPKSLLRSRFMRKHPGVPSAMNPSEVPTRTLTREELQMLSEAIPQQVWTARADGALDFVNGRVLEYFGRSFDDMIGSGWLDVVHPDDMPRVVEQWMHAVATGEPYEVEFRLLRAADGSYRSNLGRALAVRDAEGRVVKWFGTNTDITERKAVEEQRDRALQSERELRAKEVAANRRSTFLAEASAILGASLDYETTLRNVVELAVPKLADWCSVEILQDDGSIHLLAVSHVDPAKLDLADEMRREYPFPPDARHGVPNVIRTGRAELYEAITDEMLSSAAVDARHLELQRVLGFRSALIVPLTVQNRTFGAMTMNTSAVERAFTAEDLSFAEDLASRVALSVENARLFHEAKRASQAKDHFLAVLSHELRTPLTPVLMVASAIAADPTISPELREDIAVIRRNVELEARLIDDLLDLTRISNGKLQIQSRCVDANELVAQAARIVGSDAASEQPSMRLQLAAERSQVRGDPARLQQIFWNLLRNAVKFTPADGEVRVVTSNPTPDFWRIEVIDTGKGISAGALPTIFNAFEQGGTDVSQRFGGLGLGLAISRALAELHGGRLTAESAGAGLGATFTFELNVLDMDAVTSDHRPEVAAPCAGRSLRILLVEDHETTGNLIERLLTRRGHFPVLARNMADALALANAREFDIVVSDLGLPDGTGFDLMRELQARHGLTGIALSGYGTEADVALALDAGFIRHLTKPIDVEQLEAALRDTPLSS